MHALSVAVMQPELYCTALAGTETNCNVFLCIEANEGGSGSNFSLKQSRVSWKMRASASIRKQQDQPRKSWYKKLFQIELGHGSVVSLGLTASHLQRVLYLLA
jgi:hypothetical protein